MTRPLPFSRTRDFPSEFDAFLKRQKLDISVEELFHVSGAPETADAIRQHNHVIVRSPRSRQPLSLCAGNYNWDNLPVRPVDVLVMLAATASIVDTVDGDFVAWAESFDLSPDSRGVEREFRRALQLTTLLRTVLGDRGYDELLGIYKDMAMSLAADAEVGDLFDEEGQDKPF